MRQAGRAAAAQGSIDSGRAWILASKRQHVEGAELDFVVLMFECSALKSE